MQFIGSAPSGIMNDADGTQCVHVGMFVPTQRYGTLVVVNSMSQAFHGDADEHAVRLTPIIDEVQ